MLILAFFQQLPEKNEKISCGEWLINVLLFIAKWEFHYLQIVPQYPDKGPQQIVFFREEPYCEIATIIDPLVESGRNNVAKSTHKMNQIQDAFRAAATSVWADCTYCNKKTNMTKEDNIYDNNHSLLGAMFIAAQASAKLCSMFKNPN